MRKCCYYEKASGGRYTLCTTGDSCPDVVGDTKISEWAVESCDECGTSEQPPEEPSPPELSTTEPSLTGPSIGTVEEVALRVKAVLPIVEFLERLKDVPAAIALLKKHGLWPPGPPELREKR